MGAVVRLTPDCREEELLVAKQLDSTARSVNMAICCFMTASRLIPSSVFAQGCPATLRVAEPCACRVPNWDQS